MGRRRHHTVRGQRVLVTVNGEQQTMVWDGDEWVTVPVNKPPANMTTCPAMVPWSVEADQAAREHRPLPPECKPCGAEFYAGWWVGDEDDDVPAILNAAIAAMEIE